MKRIGFWIGVITLGAIVLMSLIGFIVTNGWSGAVFLAVIIGAAALVTLCGED